MLQFENTIRINRPLQEVYAFLADFENLPKWNYYVQKVEKTSPGPVQVGTTFHQIRKTDNQDFEITALEENRVIGIKTLPHSRPQLEMRFTFSTDGASTLLHDEWKLDTSQPALLEKLAGGKVKSAVAENLEKLKTLLETGSVTLPDERVVTHVND